MVRCNEPILVCENFKIFLLISNRSYREKLIEFWENQKSISPRGVVQKEFYSQTFGFHPFRSCIFRPNALGTIAKLLLKLNLLNLFLEK